MSLIPEQVVIAKCSNIGIQITGSGKEYVSADFPVNVNGEEQTVEWRGWLTEKTMERTIEALRAMGWYGDDLFELKRDGALRNEVQIDIRHEEYKGKVSARVSFINPKPDDPAAAEKKRLELASKFKKLAQKTKPERQPGEDDDDVGF